MSYSTNSTILLIEADTSLRRLITLGLQYRGMRVIETSSPDQLPQLSSNVLEQPDILICDVDGKASLDKMLLPTIQTHFSIATVPVIVLTWECLIPSIPATTSHTNTSSLTACLAKPFDVRTLYATIDQLLEAKATQAHELFLQTRPASSTPSIWPLITAFGLLLVFIGMLGLMILTAFGLLVVLMGLLWWTLGTKRTRAVSTRPSTLTALS